MSSYLFPTRTPSTVIFNSANFNYQDNPLTVKTAIKKGYSTLGVYLGTGSMTSSIPYSVFSLSLPSYGTYFINGGILFTNTTPTANMSQSKWGLTSTINSSTFLIGYIENSPCPVPANSTESMPLSFTYICNPSNPTNIFLTIQTTYTGGVLSSINTAGFSFLNATRIA